MQRYLDSYVQSVVSSDRIYFVDVKQGWAGICDVLGLPVPHRQFPLIFEHDNLENALELIHKEAYVNMYAFLLGSFLLVVFVASIIYMIIAQHTKTHV
jgi:hypothetical protein